MIPNPKISTEQWNKFLKDPEVVTLEILFVLLTIFNVIVLYRILLDVCPFPIAITWFQLLMGFFFAAILGGVSSESPRCAYFPPFSLDLKLCRDLALPTLVYLGMITLANVLLKTIPSVASFPVAVSLAVFLHHVSRFFGCGQIYLPVRWISLAIMLTGFFIGLFDPVTIGLAAFPIALSYALCSSIFRAWCLEKAMHVVEGRGNTLHNHQVVMGLTLLPPVSFIAGEFEIFSWMPTNLTKFFTWQSWGVLVVAGTIPFIKNLIANRMIRRTGQAPWRILEAISMILVFGVGAAVWDSISIASVIAFILVFTGRVLGSLDVLSKDPAERRRALRQEVEHGASPPSPTVAYDPTGVADSFDRPEDTIEPDKEEDLEMSHKAFEAPQHYAVKPLLMATQEVRF